MPITIAALLLLFFVIVGCFALVDTMGFFNGGDGLMKHDMSKAKLHDMSKAKLVLLDCVGLHDQPSQTAFVAQGLSCFMSPSPPLKNPNF